MFEEKMDVKNQVNKESYNPHNLKRPNVEPPQEYEDTPEFRKSLNMRGRSNYNTL